MGAAVNSEASAPEEMVSSLIVKPHAEAGARLSSALQAFDAKGLSKSALVPLTVGRSMSGKAHVVKLEQPVTLSEARVIAARLMHNDPSLEYAEPDRMVYPLTTPTDPGYGNQWHYFAPNGTTNKGGANLPLAWDVTKGSPSVVVALIDNGYRPHIDFPQLLPGFDFITDPTAAHDGDGRDADARDPSDAVVAGECGVGTPAKTGHWHGTFMLGLLGAVMNNGQGGTGVAPTAGIVPVRVIGKCGGLTSDVVDGMRWAAGLSVAGVPANLTPAKVMSISIGAPGACGSTFQAAVTEIVNAGTVIAVATGNPYWVKFIEMFAQPARSAVKVTRANEARREDFSTQVRLEHEKIVAAIAAGDPDAARAAAAEHMLHAAERVRQADHEFWRGDGGALARHLVQDA